MRKLCPTCGGNGSIPDPKYYGVPLLYCGPNGEGCPYIICQTCWGSGWVDYFEERSYHYNIIDNDDELKTCFY